MKKTILPKPKLEFPKSFIDAHDMWVRFMNNPRSRAGFPKLDRETELRAISEPGGHLSYDVRYRGTSLVKFCESGIIVLNMDGQQTPTRRKRMRRAGVAMDFCLGVARVWHAGLCFAYQDFMSLYPNGGAEYFGRIPAEFWSDVFRRRAENKKRWEWPNDRGGYAHGGNCPEAFHKGKRSK